MIHPARQHLLDAIQRNSAVESDLFARVQSAAHDADTSPFSRRHPTQAQLEANSYRTGRVSVQGLPLRIESPRGTHREKPGKFSNLMLFHYGDIECTVGNDGDPIDVFIGPFPELPVVYVVNQVGLDGAFDEHKVCMGFASEADARMGYLSAYAPGWDGLDSIVRATMAQFKWWLKFGDKSRPFTPDVLPYEGQATMDKVLWNSQAEPVTKPLNTIIYELRGEDAGHGLMLDAVTMAELMADPDIEAVPVLDAMVVEVGRLQPKMEVLQRIMAAAGESVKPTEMAISDPVRYKGAAQVMVLFTMSDGQTVSVWFHNPDTTPAKLMPLDELISWKWMLNKKDVTIVVAPERGRDLNPREVSRRIMRLVERNSAAFLKANTKVAEKAAQLQALDTEIAELQTELTDVQRQIELAKVEAESRPKKVWQSEKNQDPAGGAQLIEAWDTEKADALAYGLVGAGSVREFFAQHLAGRTVMTKVGPCYIGGRTGREIANAAGRKGGIRLRLAPRVPEILIKGDVLPDKPISDPSNNVKRAGFTAMVPFVHSVDLGDLRVRAEVKAGRRDGAVPLVYSLRGLSGMIEDGNEKADSLRSALGATDGDQAARGKRAGKEIMDAASLSVNDDDGLNIEILQVWDAEGNELDLETGERLVPVAADVSFDDFLAAVVIELSTKGNMSAAEAKKLTDDEVTNLVRDGFDDKTPAAQVADQILAANKRSPAVERAYAIAGILMTQYGWSKSDENEYPESGIFVDSPRGTVNWVKLWADGVELRIDKSRSLLANPSVDESVEAIAASLDAGDARAAEAAKPVPDPAPEPNPSPEPTSEATDAEKVDAAYKFANASDAFKSEVAGSIGQDSYSPFLSAKNIDEAAKKHGATVTWRLAMVLDSVGEAGDDEDPDEDVDFDVEAEFDACPDGDDAVLDALILDGDFKGHPFRGNQYKKASSESGLAVRSSMKAKHAEKHGDPKAQKKAHKTAYFAHMAAAEDGKGKARSYHRKMAKFHGGRSGVVLDSVEESLILDDADAYESIVGTIKKGSKIVGRAHVGGDGKAMIFLGKTGKTRAKYVSPVDGVMREFMWSDDDVGDMVDALFTVPKNGVAKVAPVVEPAPVVPAEPARSTQFLSYMAAINEGKATPGMLEQISTDARLEDGEAEILIAEAKSVMPAGPGGATAEIIEGSIGAPGGFALTVGGLREEFRSEEAEELVDNARENAVATGRNVTNVLAAMAMEDGWDKRQADAAPEPTAPTPADNDLTRLNALKKLAPKDREAVTSDDPRAIEKLQAKLNYLVAYGDMMRKANKLVRKNDRDGLTAMGFNGRTLESLFEKDFAGRIGFADYMMTNNNGVIRTTRLRLEELQAAEMAKKVEPPVEPAPTTGTSGTTMQDPQKATDTAYLQSLIDGTGDLLAEDTFEKLEPMFTTYEGDAEMMALLEQAAEAYGDAAVEAAKQALAT